MGCIVHGVYELSFRAHLPTLSTVLIETTAQEAEGQKIFINVIMEGTYDVMYATCDGMWISVRTKRKL
jgi:hypothetical protein